MRNSFIIFLHMFVVFLLDVSQLHVNYFICLYLVLLTKSLLNFNKSGMKMIFHKICYPFRNNIFEHTSKQIDNVLIIDFFISNDNTFENLNIYIWIYIFFVWLIWQCFFLSLCLIFLHLVTLKALDTKVESKDFICGLLN
jgi:hypothetical protein